MNFIGQLKDQVVAEEKRAQIEATDLEVATEKAAAEQAKADAECARAKEVEKLRLVTEERAATFEVAYKAVDVELIKVRADLVQVQKSIVNAYKQGDESATNTYADEALKFKNRGFKHEQSKALEIANITLDMSIPFENEGIEALYSNPEQTLC